MKVLASRFLFVVMVVSAGLYSPRAEAQWDRAVDEINFTVYDLSGPRLGFTLVPPGSALYDSLQAKEISPFFSQFGWHFEQQITPRGGGPALVFQLVPLVGAVESGKMLLSTTLAMGIRLPDGMEFGIGPNMLFLTEKRSSLVISLGKTTNYNGVNIPVNIALSTNKHGLRVSLIAGYAIEKK